MSEKIAALICIWFVVFINCYSVKLTQKFLKFFGYGKIVSLAVIIGGGIYFNLTGKAEQSRDSRTARSADRIGRHFRSKFLVNIFGSQTKVSVPGSLEKSTFKYENAFQFDNNGSFIFPQGMAHYNFLTIYCHADV